MNENKSLYDEMKEFQHEKKKYFIGLIILGFLGLLLPIIPGLALIGLGIVLIIPETGAQLMQRVKDGLKSFIS